MNNEVAMAPETEIVHVEKVEDLLEIAEKRSKWMDQLIQMSLARLRPGDVNSMDGKPYINSDGCYKVARLWGVEIHYTDIPRKFEAKDKKGEYYFYVHRATVSLKGGESVDVVGNCSSRDPFYAKAHGEWKLMEDIDELDIMQKAQTATDRKGIAKLLGLNNITWDDIAKYAKITQQDCASFSFKKPASQKSENRPQRSDSPQKGAATPEAPKSTPAQAQSSPSDPITDLRNEVLDAVKSAVTNDDRHKGKKIADVVRELSGGKVSLGLCNEDELSMILDKLNS